MISGEEYLERLRRLKDNVYRPGQGKAKGLLENRRVYNFDFFQKLS